MVACVKFGNIASGSWTRLEIIVKWKFNQTNIYRLTCVSTQFASIESFVSITLFYILIITIILTTKMQFNVIQCLLYERLCQSSLFSGCFSHILTCISTVQRGYYPRHILTFRWDRNDIPTAIPHFQGRPFQWNNCWTCMMQPEV